MLRLKPNTFVYKASQLESAYCVCDGEIKANVHAPLILDMCLRFLYINKDKHLFFYLEAPEALKREADISSFPQSQGDMNAYRVDFESFEKASALLFFFSDLLSRDGICRFRFGTNDGEEIDVGKYNIVTVRCNDTEKYESLFIDANIPKTENLITAYDTFSKKSPGFTKICTYKGMNVHDIPEYLKMYGIIS